MGPLESGFATGAWAGQGLAGSRRGFPSLGPEEKSTRLWVATLMAADGPGQGGRRVRGSCEARAPPSL